ncbi:MAG: exodeoxyribonuclease III, partial [Gammaproteobacteria bacterium]
TYGRGAGALRVVNVYVPNGERVGSPKYRYKLRWLEALEGWLRGELARHPRLVVLGDFNIAPADEDVHDPLVWTGRIMCSEPERERFRRLLALGLCDTYRLFPQEGSPFTWWDYRMRAFQRDLGLRIDHILASPPLCEACTACRIDRAPRALPRPSDHAPVVAEFRA